MKENSEEMRKDNNRENDCMSCCVLRGLSRQKVGTDWLCWDGGWLKSLRNLLSRDGYYQTSSDITKIWQGSRIKWKRIKWTKYWLPGISTNVSEMQLNTLLRQNIGVIPNFTSVFWVWSTWHTTFQTKGIIS